MGRTARLLSAVVAMWAMAGPSHALGQSSTTATTAQEAPPFTLNVGAQVQVRYSYLDREGEDARGSFGIRRARLRLGGTAYQHFAYAIQVDLGGANARLLDANIRYALAPMATVWFGQGKPPFGRQQLTSSGNLQMVDRAMPDGRFAPGRQVGMALLGQNAARTFEYGAGVYNGNGIAAANPDMRHMVVGRAVWTPLGAYAPVESAFDYPSDPRVALGVSAMHNAGVQAEGDGDMARIGLEGAFKVRGVSTTGEYYHERLSPVVGDGLDTRGWYVQGGYLFPGRQHELAARYGAISSEMPANTDMVEAGIGYSLYLNAHRAKLQTDLRTVERKAVDTRDLELRVQFQLNL